MNPSDVMELHQEIGEALAHTVDDQTRKNVRMQQRIAELEATLNPCPFFVKPLAIVHSIEESLGQSQKIDKVTQFLSRIKSFFAEGIKFHSYLIAKTFRIMENVYMMGSCIKSFRYIMASDLQHDENLSLNHVATFSLKVQSLIEESRERQSLPTLPRIKQIWFGCKGSIDILKSLMEKATLLEDQKSAIFFKVFDVIKELEGPPLIKVSTLISVDELDNELCELKDKWVGEFNDLLDFSKDGMLMWTVDCQP